MSDALVCHAPCPECGSTDNVAVYDDGHGHCFGCEAHWPPGSFEQAEFVGKDPGQPGEGAASHDLHLQLDIVPLPKRNLTQTTCRQYGYGLAPFGRDGTKHQFATYHDDKGRPVAQKVRGPDKFFTVLGDMSKATLFGQKICRSGGKMLVVTEGEIDALSVAQAFNNRWPAVSVPNGASGASKSIKANLEFVSSFDKVVFCYDQDEPGQTAAADCAALLPPGKAHIASLPRKDANEMLQADEAGKLSSAIWDAREYRPDGVVNLKDLKARIATKPQMGTPYPWPELNALLYGMRGQELTTWCAGTGAGKSSVVSEIVYDLITQREQKVGVVYLEEGVERSGQRLVGLALGKPIHLPGTEYTDDEFNEAFDRTLGTGRVVAYDAFGTINLDVLLSRLRYMVVGLDCSTVVLDHVSMLASGADAGEDERRLLDRTMTELRTLAQDTGVCLHVVSHLRRIGQSRVGHEGGDEVSLSHLRGSQAIAQLSDNIVALERDQQAEDLAERNVTQMRVLKNRYAGQLGPAGKLVWDQNTGRLKGQGEAALDAEDY